MHKPKLVIMAAGLGSRYGGLKQMESVTKENEIILDFAVYDAMKAGFEEVIFIIKPEMEQMMRDLVGDYISRKTAPDGSPVEVAYAYQDFL